MHTQTQIQDQTQADRSDQQINGDRVIFCARNLRKHLQKEQVNMAFALRPRTRRGRHWSTLLSESLH